MKAIDFSQSTKVLQKPSTLTDKECNSLHVYCDTKQCVSCWKPSFVERLKIIFGGVIWLGVLSGSTQPPVFVTAQRIFSKMPLKIRMADFFARVKKSIALAWKSVKNGFKQSDKRKHFIAGFCISLSVGIVSPFGGCSLACCVGAAKEWWWDAQGHGTVEKMDCVFTCLGALAAFPFSLILHCLIW